ncbi:MAG: WD40 repeat domain-containing protein, partial [Dolichospermum sp.]
MNKILEIGQERLTLKAHSDSVTAIAFTPDGKTVISGSRDNTIKAWDLKTGEVKLT